MKEELSRVMHSMGAQVHFWNPTGTSRKASQGFSGKLLVLRFAGSCVAPLVASQPLANLASLATTAVVQGQVLPFSSVDCDAVSRFLSNTLTTTPAAQRDFVYGRALARIAAHELYHALTRQTAHAPSGVAKSAFTLTDLLTDRDFRFEEEGRLQPVRDNRGSE